jgi:hypothetical protein
MFAIKGMKDATTSRPSSSAILAIDSEDRFKDFIQARTATAGIAGGKFNRSPYDFQISKNESLMNGFFTRLALTEVNFPWVIPNINVRTQDIQITYQVGAGPIVVDFLTLPIAFYTPADIAAAIEAGVLAIVGNPIPAFTMVYGAGDIPRFTYNTNDAAITFAFEPMDYNSTLYPYPPTTKQLFDLLGFNDDNTILGANNVVEDGGSTFCQAIRYIDIVCSQLTYNQAVKDTMSQQTARDTLCRLYLGDGPYTGTSTLNPSDPLFCPPGCAPFTIYRQFTNPKFIRWMADQPVQGNLQFQVFDDDGSALETALNNTYTSAENWSFTLLVSED